MSKDTTLTLAADTHAKKADFYQQAADRQIARIQSAATEREVAKIDEYWARYNAAVRLRNYHTHYEAKFRGWAALAD